MDTNYEYQIQNPTSSNNDIFDLNSYNQGLGANVYKSDFKSSVDNSSIITQSSPFSSKHDDLKSMLESNKDGLKLEAMKKLITMVAKGRTSSADVSAKELFPHVVKNVVTKNAELKKLVYLYLLRYAEQEPDLILLSISTFQRSLKDPNPLMRASALRVMSSIRVKIIAPIMYISIKDCSNDMSPYVRKTAAHAIPKLYNLEPEMKDDIIAIIEKLLQDRTSLVLGSAVAAFEEVCPDRFDLIHSNYRKFVSLIGDFDEWGQQILINMLIRYGRLQFLNPNILIKQTETEGDEEEDENELNYLDNLDPDHRLLLKNAKPLLQSRNSAVVMAVIQLYLYLAPNSELNSSIVRPLIRLLHSKPEIQIVILTNIVSLTSSASDDDPLNDDDEKEEERQADIDETFLMDTTSANRPDQLSLKTLFEPLLKSFFVKSKDPTQVRILKLKILTNLSSSFNIPLILREFQAYINNYQDDMQFVSATIEAIGKCASRIKEIASICLNGLISLLSNRNEAIIAQSIIVIRKQIINKQRQIDRKLLLTNGLQNGQIVDGNNLESNELKESKESPSSTKSSSKRKKGNEKSDHIISLVIKQVSKLIVDKIKTPTAKATVLWILAEFCDKNTKAYQLSPDILRLVAKSFINEVEIVKLQAINLAAKVYLTTCYFETCKNYFTIDDKERIKLLINYIFNLAKYDLNYDVRDRARFLRQLLNKSNTPTGLILAQKVLMAPKNIFIDNKSKDEQDQPLNENLKEDTERTKTLPCLVNGMSKYRIGTLSHFIGKAVNNYEELPDFPTERPDPTVRNTRIEEEDANKQSRLDKEFDLSSPIKKRLNRSDSNENFYSDESGSDEESGSSASTEDSGESSDESGSEDEKSVEQSDEESSSSSSESGSESNDSEDDSSSSESEESLKNNENGLSIAKGNQNLSKDELIKC